MSEKQEKSITRAVGLQSDEYKEMMIKLKAGNEYTIIGRDGIGEPCELRDGKPYEKNTNKPICDMTEAQKNATSIKMLSTWGMLTALGAKVLNQEGNMRTLEVSGMGIVIFNMDTDRIEGIMNIKSH